MSTPNLKPDAHVETVRSKLLERSQRGIQKYGTTTERGDLTESQWLQHAQEESLDLAVYLERLLWNRREPQPAEAESFQSEQWAWVQTTFPGETAEEVFRHFQEEVKELGDAEDDPEEMADCFLLLQCLASHHGVDLMESARAKFERCKLRTWEKTERGFRHTPEQPVAEQEGAMPKIYRHHLWQFFSDEHGLTLTESELNEIVRVVNLDQEKDLSRVQSERDQYSRTCSELTIKLEAIQSENADLRTKLTYAEDASNKGEEGRKLGTS